MKAAIIGATGYGGADLIRLLHNHPEVELRSVHSSSQQGIKISESYPHLQGITDLVLQDIDPLLIKQQADVVFLSTPPGVSRDISGQLLEAGLKVIDLSGDLRLVDGKVYEQWYGIDAANASLLEKAVYGLPEWEKEKIQSAELISNPGCYPTATLLGLLPLVKNDLIDNKSIIIDAKSAVSGAGRSPSPVTHFSEMNDNFKIYKVNQHKHIPEIEQGLNVYGSEVPFVTFSTHLVPMTRGIMSTIYMNSANSQLTEKELRDLFEETYKNAPFVRVRKTGEYPSTKEVYGTNYCDIGVTYDDRTGRITVVSVIDNLMKGAAGQAIQNLNIMNGFEETSGLNYIPTYP
ncbi:N-acetyl-gamma-glutamyl-phosphate reductase [Alkalihalobacterium chitinilyticum]|uniref:N-acetyl-gamma-glutamyl-phosphate reductase n=1 Tax=Alkalihalobacterium chitinilyticum TaxID=2980103 RepID=A0ABT5VCX1_9BACI|nr:N-acetyl-gamma-glutamyl-phosphate reductase [Alkalihalobacterium chitinilyticum]MDE5412587.1 N-acetyl-gamma-glutamyl-phosphate reductase [Alkalihalobacterium chitinilyticum]